MKFAVLRLLLLTASLAWLSGCMSAPGSFAPQESTKYTVENTEKFQLLDGPPQIYVSCTGLQEHLTADGRLEVVANIRNRENRPLQVQVSCVFKDIQGFATGDETPFQTIRLAANATEVIRFRAVNTLGKKYTIRLREAR